MLNCNKIKKLEANKEDLLAAISKSDQVELDESKDKLRRLGNKALPEFTLLSKKRNSEKSAEKDEKNKDSDLTFDP